LAFSINYDAKRGPANKDKGKGRGAFACLMKPKILSWNLRGLNGEKKMMKTTGLIGEWKADIVCLQETKLQVINREDGTEFGGLRSCGLVFFRVESNLQRYFADVG
jgi:hypothetical protein